MVELPKFCPSCGAPAEARVIRAGEPARGVCTGCARVHYLGPRLAAGVLCRLGDELVLGRRGIEPGYGRWVYPGGFVDVGESPAEAARREALEEVGLDVRLDGLLGVYHNIERAVVIVVYTGRAAGGEPGPSEEVLETRLFPLTDLPWNELAFPTTRQALEDYLRMLG